jgi:hypothetical protein
VFCVCVVGLDQEGDPDQKTAIVALRAVAQEDTKDGTSDRYLLVIIESSLDKHQLASRIL